MAVKMNELTKQTVIIEAKRIIEILENTPNEELDKWSNYSTRSELKTKMRELRRDTMRLEKELYPKY